MADTISITQGNTTIVVTPIKGSVRAGGGHEDRGGGVIPSVRAGIAKNGSCQIVITSATATNKQHTLAEVLSIISEEGEGAATVQGAASGKSPLLLSRTAHSAPKRRMISLCSLS